MNASFDSSFQLSTIIAVANSKKKLQIPARQIVTNIVDTKPEQSSEKPFREPTRDGAG